MSTVRFQPNGDWQIVTFAYNPKLVATVKAIPGWGRKWNPQTRQWRVHELFATELADTLRRLGHTVIDVRAEARGRHGDDSWAELLFQRVGASRADAVHRALTRVLHPDTPTGDHRLQQELNDARARAQLKPKRKAA